MNITMEITQMIAFGAVCIAISLLTLCVFQTVRYGKKCAASGIEHIPFHRQWVNRTILATLLLVVTIETFSHFSPTHMTGSWIFMVHMFFAVPFLLLLLILRFWADGISSKNIHKPLAYVTSACFVGVLVTGTTMLVKMIPS